MGKVRASASPAQARKPRFSPASTDSRPDRPANLATPHVRGPGQRPVCYRVTRVGAAARSGFGQVFLGENSPPGLQTLKNPAKSCEAWASESDDSANNPRFVTDESTNLLGEHHG
jgi:hypothetical protein